MVRIAILYLCLSFGIFIEASISSTDIINSVLTHHPKIKMQQTKKLSRESQFLSSKGLFDTKLEFKTNIRSQGYYDGEYSELLLAQPIPALNAQVYGGYRKSDGDFPIYEDQYITNGNGESLIGVSVSLLGNGELNDAILSSKISKIDIEIANEYLTLEELKMMNIALTYYWKCIYYAQVTYAYTDLYQTAVKRHDGIQRRVNDGDLPQTYLLENLRTLYQREADLIAANQSFQLMANNLSLYYRSNSGEPIVITIDQLPSEFETMSDPEEYDITINKLLQTHPLLAQIKLEQTQLEHALRLANNQNLPKIDLGYEYSDDHGDGSDSRDQKESKIKASLKMSLQRRKATGKILEIKQKLHQLNLLTNWLKEQLKVELKKHDIGITTLKKSVENRKKVLDLSKQLFEAENIRLNSGDSDFFQLNTSEQYLIKSNLSYLKDKLDLNLHIVDYTMFFL